jgi:hypothetical protein
MFTFILKQYEMFGENAFEKHYTSYPTGVRQEFVLFGATEIFYRRGTANDCIPITNKVIASAMTFILSLAIDRSVTKANLSNNRRTN